MLLWVGTRLPALLGIAALLVLAAVVARGTSAVPVGVSQPLFGWLRFPNFNLPDGIPTANTNATRADGGWAVYIGWAVMLLPVLMLAVAIVAVLVIAFRQRKIGAPSPVRREDATGYPGTNLAAQWLPAARAARDALDRHAGGPPSDAVIAAWLELENVAADSGTERHAHETPTEFTSGLIIKHSKVNQPLNTLKGLYHKARFGPPGTIKQRQADEARAALDEIVDALTETANR